MSDRHYINGLAVKTTTARFIGSWAMNIQREQYKLEERNNDMPLKEKYN